MKLRALLQKRTVKAYTTDLLRNGLGMAPEPAQLTSDRIEINENGFPIIRCRPGAPAEKMTAEELLRIEQQALEAEDLARAGITP